MIILLSIYIIVINSDYSFILLKLFISNWQKNAFTARLYMYDMYMYGMYAHAELYLNISLSWCKTK